MAWWDHEELKSKEYRSDRYILTFPEEYSKEEVDAARIRSEKERLNRLSREIPAS